MQPAQTRTAEPGRLVEWCAIQVQPFLETNAFRAPLSYFMYDNRTWRRCLSLGCKVKISASGGFGDRNGSTTANR